MMTCSILLLCFTGCQSKGSKEVVATVNGNNIYMSEIEDDILFYSKINNLDLNNPETKRTVVLDVLNTYLIDYTCKAELDALGMQYKSEYYGASYETLIEAYGSEANLISFIRSLGLNKEYVEEICRKQARKATLSEYIISKITIPEEEVLQYYIENSADFTTEEARTMYSIYYKTIEEATMALSIINDMGFKEFFKEQDSNPDSLYHILFESVTKEEFASSPNVQTILFGLEEGTYHNEPIPCNVGYVLIYVDDIKTNYTFTYDEMKDAIEEVLIDELADQELQKFFEELNTKYKVNILYK